MDESPNLDVVVAADTDVGRVRTTNEDSVLAVVPSDAEIRRVRGALTVVADGMGGHAAGEVASSLAIDVVGRAYYEHEGSPREALLAAFEDANRAIFEAAKTAGQHGMGTTCCALVVCRGHAFCANVGDSRLYLVRGDHIYLMTTDDSAVQDLVTKGVITLDEARHHADRNVILRALGTHETVAVASWSQPFPVRVGDIFVLCSDGLYDLVEDDEIRRTVLSADGPSACRALISEAKHRAGTDNISVAIVQLKEADGAARPRNGEGASQGQIVQADARGVDVVPVRVAEAAAGQETREAAASRVPETRSFKVQP
ncbi:MAG: PP2C family serine/threonine-protein phosphatase [Vicinamibacterales bacterium]